MTIQLKQRQITVKEYHQMIEAGILTENDKVELINGKIVEMSPIGSKHAACLNRIVKLLTRLLPPEYIVSPQNPITVPDHSEPEPDISILKPSLDFYEQQHPQPEDVLLLIEVADSSLKIDQEIKIPIYAAASVAEVWIVNIPQQQVERYYQPEDGVYRHRELYTAAHTIPLAAFDLSVVAKDILG